MPMTSVMGVVTDMAKLDRVLQALIESNPELEEIYIWLVPESY